MTTQANTISGKKGARHKSKRLGRGNSSQKGTYSGKGLKGQKARSGGKSGNARRSFKQSLQKIPKVRGFKSLNPAPDVVTLKTLNGIANDGDVVDIAYLKVKKIITKSSKGVKIVATGEMSKKITLTDIKASKGAAEAIIKAGGSVK